MNRELMFSSKTDLWATPQALFDDLNKEFGFTLDACALPENAKCERYYSPQEDGLQQPWEGVVWCNPPYGRQIGEWVKKAALSVAGGVQPLLCFFRQERIPSGSMITYTDVQKSGF